MNDYKKLLTEQKATLNKLIREAKKRLRYGKDVDTRNISFSKRRNGYQYYLTEPDGKRIYVKAKDIDIVRSKLQREYDVAVCNMLTKLLKRLDVFLKKYDFDAVAGLYENMSEARKCLINPLITPNRSFVEKWENDNAGDQNSYYESGLFLTDRGENVRSKSEKILADLFYKKAIPYSYEPRYELSDGSVLFPDFVLLNVRTRKTVYWEHFGLISDPDYAIKTLKKLCIYEKNGLKIGEDLLFSMESEEMPLDIKQIEIKIKEHLT